MAEGLTRKATRCAIVLVCAAACLATSAHAESRKILGSTPPDGGQLVGNVITFVGYDLVKTGEPIKVQVTDIASKSEVPSRVKGHCLPPKSAGVKGAKAKRRCFVEVRLLHWLPGKKYEAIFLDYSIRFTTIEGDPGKKRRKRR